MSIDVWTKVRWGKEACDLRPDPVSGAAITRLTGSPLPSNNNYFPAACSANGRRVAATRFGDWLVSSINALLVLDIDTKWTALLDPSLGNVHVHPIPFTGICYYSNRDDELCRVSLDTFDKEVVMSLRGVPPVDDCLRANTPDGRYLFYVTRVAITAGQSMAVIRLDLQDKSWQAIYENPGLTHITWLRHANGLSVGRRILPDGSTPPLGAWKNSNRVRGDLQLMDLDGRLLRPLGLAPGYTFIHPETGQCVCNCPYDQTRLAHLADRHQGNMVVFDSIGGKQTRVIEAPDHLFFHIAGSRCGRYVVSEATRVGQGPFGPVDVVVVNWQTGKHRVLVSDCGSLGSGGGNAIKQVTPYMTSDNSHVVYNADPEGVLNVYAAQLPEGFLASLDDRMEPTANDPSEHSTA